MRRLGVALLLIGVVFAAIGAPLAVGAQQLPKLKKPGQITAGASTSSATASQARYTVAWATGLQLRDSTLTGAICITIANHDPELDGLHFEGLAARELANALRREATSAAVDVLNHRQHVVNVWERFSATDARALAARIDTAATGHP